MSKRHRSREALHSSDEITLFSSGRAPRTSRKALQLAEQARAALHYALAEASNPTLADAQLIGVEPAPDASRLAVTVALGEGVSLDVLIAALEGARTFLSQAVASAITRKRAPTLLFQVVPGPLDEDPR